MLSSCLAKIRDLLLKSLDAIPASLFSSTILYLQSSSFSVFFFPPLYCVVLTVNVWEELGCRFYWLFALLSATVYGSLGLCFFSLFCLMPLICCAFSFCHSAFFFFLLWVPSDYFLLQYFNPFFLFLVLCTLWLNIFFYAWGPTHRSHGFHTFCLCFCFLFCVIKLHTLHALPRLFLHPPIELSIPHTFQS